MRLWSLICFALVMTTSIHLAKAQSHPNNVPDKVTAIRIAEAVLIARFGQTRVNAQLPLIATSPSKDLWLVVGRIKDSSGRPQVGGGFGVWVDKQKGCVTVMEQMK